MSTTELPLIPVNKHLEGLRLTEDWADLYQDGDRLNLIIKQCYTKCQTPRKSRLGDYPSRTELSEDMKLAYMDRLIKAELAKLKVIELVLGVRQMIKDKK